MATSDGVVSTETKTTSITPPLPERPKLKIEDIVDAAMKKSREQIGLIHNIDPHVKIYQGPSTHISEETGSLSGVVYDVASNVPAHMVICTADIGGGRSLYEIPLPSNSKATEVEKKMSDVLETIKKSGFDWIQDSSLPFERVDGTKRNLSSPIVLGKSHTSFGFYSMPASKHADARYFIVVQAYHEYKELQELVKIGTSIESVYSNVLYTQAIRLGRRDRDLVASILSSLVLGKQDTNLYQMTKEGVEVMRENLLQPLVDTTYNIIVRDGSNEGRYRYYDHCYFSENLESGFLVGMGARKGYAWLRLKKKSVQKTISWSHDATKGLVPMGTRRLTPLASGSSLSRRGEKVIVTWGTNVPNPKSDAIYDDFTVDSKFYKSFSALGYDFADKAISYLYPIKVYVSTPEPIVRRLTLKQWVDFPMDPDGKL